MAFENNYIRQALCLFINLNLNITPFPSMMYSLLIMKPYQLVHKLDYTSRFG